MEVAKFILDCVRVILSWPVLTATVILYFLIKFRPPIIAFINRLVTAAVNKDGLVLTSTLPTNQSAIELNLPKESSKEEDKQLKIESAPTLDVTKTKEYQGLLEKYMFERIFFMIYGSQIRLLEHLELKGPEGDLESNLLRFYFEFKMLLKDTDYSPLGYIGFLQAVLLIERISSTTYKITPHGIAFLNYIRSAYPLYKSKPW